MIIVETPIKTIDAELQALANGVLDCEVMMFAYAQGARQALEWIKNKRTKPSDIVSGGIVTLTAQ